MIEKPSTKDVLAASLMELTKTQSIDDISISEIVENCGMSKGTFYYHFPNITECIAYTCFELGLSVAAGAAEPKTFAQFWEASTEAYRQKADFYVQVFLRSNPNLLIRERFNKIGEESVRRMVEFRLGTSELDEELEYQIRFFSHGMHDMFFEWLADGCVRSSEETIAMSLSCMPERLKAVIRPTEPCPEGVRAAANPKYHA